MVNYKYKDIMDNLKIQETSKYLYNISFVINIVKLLNLDSLHRIL